MATAAESLIEDEDDSSLDNMLAFAYKIGVPKESIENLLRYGIVLQPKQLKATAAARECDYPGGPTQVAIGGARGGGKSFWGLAQIGIDDCERYPGLKCLFLRKVGKAAKESFDDLRAVVFKHKKYKYNRHEGILEFQNGSKIILGHFKDEKEIDNYLGQEYGVILIEEATTLSLKKVKAIRSCNRQGFNANQKLMPWRPRMYYTTNPGGIGHSWFKSTFVIPYRDKNETDTRFIPATVDDNFFINEDYVNILETFTGWLYKAWRFGDWDVSAGQFFTTWKDDVHVAREPIEIQAGWKCWLSMDYGFTHHNVVHLIAETNDGDLKFIDEHAARGWLPERHSNAIDDMLARNGVDRSRISTFVAGHDIFAKDDEGRTTADKYRILGWRIVRANVDRLNGAAEWLHRLGNPTGEGADYIRPTIQISPKCRLLIATLPILENDPNRPEDVLKIDCDEEGNGGDDAYDCARYGIMVAKVGDANVSLEAAKALAGLDDDEEIETATATWSLR